jgi:hypothetical protein
MNDDILQELMQYVRQAEANVPGLTRDAKIKVLRRHHYRCIGKTRWQSPDGDFIGTVAQCYGRIMAAEREGR